MVLSLLSTHTLVADYVPSIVTDIPLVFNRNYMLVAQILNLSNEIAYSRVEIGFNVTAGNEFTAYHKCATNLDPNIEWQCFYWSWTSNTFEITVDSRVQKRPLWQGASSAQDLQVNLFRSSNSDGNRYFPTAVGLL